MDNIIIIMGLMHRNAKERVKICKVFLWFGLIKSTQLIFFKAIDYICQHNPEMVDCMILSYMHPSVHLRLKFMEETTHRC